MIKYDKYDYFWSLELLQRYAELYNEYGAEGVGDILIEVDNYIKSATARIKDLPIKMELKAKEPDALDEILKLRADGPRKLLKGLPSDYEEKVEGALLARFAGCTLSAIVENWSIEDMENWALSTGDAFPPVNYWSRVNGIPNTLRYGKSQLKDFTLPYLDGVPVDDDVAYTLLGLLIAEEYGLSFTVEDVGKAWVKYLPMACTAEGVALASLKEGISAFKTGEHNNPYCQWIGADIRSDPWGYMAPGLPEEAARMAYNDAFVSHRRNGIYGEMFFSAAIAAAFAVDNAVDALKIGLSEIPKECLLAEAVRWALEEGKNIKDYKDARAAVDEKFNGMSNVHTINNACLTIFGLMIGGDDITKVLSQTIAMGLDNDCTAATAGSIIGAIKGKKGVPEHWYKPFNNKVKSYLNGTDIFHIDDLVIRFAAMAKKAFEYK